MTIKQIAISCVTATFLGATLNSNADIIAGPMVNPANGHEYYLLSPDSWSASEAEAENLGGTLAIVKNAAEEEWIYSKFGAYDDTKRNLWIGLHRTSPGGPFVWVTGEKPDYVDWHATQPDNGSGIENCVHIWTRNSDNPDSWNDLPDNYYNTFTADTPCGVVEVPGKSNEESLTKQEKSLIGVWYHNGDPDQPCWIAGTGNLLFAINNENQDASRIIYTTDGFLFSPKWRQHAEIVKDKILWGNGVWWSRTPSKFITSEKPEAVEIDLHVIPD